MKQHVGIEGLAVAVPHRYLEIEDLARARGVDPGKYTVGLGQKQMAVTEPGEDTVALAATAAARLIRATRLDPSRIGMLVCGTETGVDHAKPVASFVQGLLGLPRSMRTFDLQHACYAGTAGLMAASEWIASGAAAGRVAIVVTSDIARYGVKTAGEPTQGAAATAMLVSDKPELLELDFGITGADSSNVHDFWRPIGSREALVDGHYSIDCYLGTVSGAYRGWKAKAQAQELIRGPGLISEGLARIVYHVPFGKMARKAHAQVRRCDLEDAGGKIDDAAEEVAGKKSFEAQVARSLELCSQVGNAYTGSLYLGLAGLLHAEGGQLAGQRIGLFSYGSGCCGEFYSGVVGKNAAEVLARSQIADVFASRERIDVPRYEELMALPYDAPLKADPAPGTFRFTGIQNHQRTYAKG
jgi:hydroxymethylglutaryl-CoA synthase